MKHKYKLEVLIEPTERNNNNFVAIVQDVGSVTSELRVIYHNADKDVPTFENFVESVLSEFSAQEVKLDNDKFLETFMENGVIEGKDFDEDTGREWETLHVEGVLVHCFNGFDWTKLEEKIDNVNSSFNEFETAIIEETLESAEEARDPYAYRGVNRMDFL